MGGPKRTEIAVVLVAALLVFAWPLREGLLRADRILFGVDVAAAQLPWAAVVPALDDPGSDAAVRRPRNPSLADQGVCFYPFYVWVAESWRSGDPPLWNPLIYAGAPGIGNPQAGALDPGVWVLAVLYDWGGRELFDRGFAWLAWLRLVVAGLGAWALARRLGLGPSGAALAGATFGLSGTVLLWLNHSLGHVTPLLPWVLYGLEGIRGARPSRAMGGTALALGLAILGGHPETAFYVGATAGLWALAIGVKDRRAGALGILALGVGTVLASVSLLPFLEYLQLSGARAIRTSQSPGLTGAGVDLLALGALVVVVGLAAWFARLHRDADPEELRGRHGWIAAAGLALAVGGTVLVLRARGLPSTAALVLVPDLFGAPGGDGYRGVESYIEVASPWVPFVSLVLALAAALSPRGVLRRRGLVIVLGTLAFLLSLEVGGLHDLFRLVPFVGLGDTVRLATVGALMLALLAGEALEHAPRACRIAAAGVLLLPLAGSLLDRGPKPLPDSARVTADVNELFGLLRVPGERMDPGGGEAIEGWIHPAVEVEGAVARVQRLDEHGRPDPANCFDLPLDIVPRPSRDVDGVDGVPGGATFFRSSHLDPHHLVDGHWRFAVDLFGAGSAVQPIATRMVGVSTLYRGRDKNPITLGLCVLGLIALVLLPRRGGAPWALGIVGVVLVQGLWFARGTNPAVPRGESFPPTRTEEILAAGLGPYRFAAEPSVLPPNTGLVRGLASVDGYDALDVASFNRFRPHALRPGAQALLDWHARGFDLDSPAFALLGVGMLVLRGPLEHAGWELVASPETEPPAECWIYSARDPLPRAFCVPEVVSLDRLRELLTADFAGWDPRLLAGIDGDWRPATPFTEARVGVPTWTNNTVSVAAELDGDGLLVLTEQSFPGWKAYVDGERAQLVTADTIFRGVPLGPGKHVVELRYEPWTVRVGTWLSLAALVLVGVFLVLPPRRDR
ncbi:MAG: YfhO family protein [Planctomycetota bacterium]|nr:YfhO family protein [Planctomycetota bacterium]